MYPPVVFKYSLVFAVSSTMVFNTLTVVACVIIAPQAEVFVNALYKSGGEKTAYAEGISGATATAHAYSGKGIFDFAGTTHYAEDSSGTYMRTSSAYY